jgi:hypothetical protein
MDLREALGVRLALVSVWELASVSVSVLALRPSG